MWKHCSWDACNDFSNSQWNPAVKSPVGYSLWWTIRVCSARKGSLFQAGGMWKGSLFQARGMWKGSLFQAGGVPCTFLGKEMWKGYLFRERYMKGCQFSKFNMWKGADFRNIVCERAPISPNLPCERIRGPDLGQSIPVWNRKRCAIISESRNFERFGEGRDNKLRNGPEILKREQKIKMFLKN